MSNSASPSTVAERGDSSLNEAIGGKRCDALSLRGTRWKTILCVLTTRGYALAAARERLIEEWKICWRVCERNLRAIPRRRCP